MKITITIDTSNAAFAPEPSAEVCRILRDIATGIDEGGIGNVEGYQRDANGNTVGRLVAEDDE